MNTGRAVISLLLVLLPGGLAAQGLGDAAARERAKRTKPEAESPRKAGPTAAVEPETPPAVASPADDGQEEPAAVPMASAPPASPEPETRPAQEPVDVWAPPAPVVIQAPAAPKQGAPKRQEGEPFAVRWHDAELHARLLGRAASESAGGETEADLTAENIRFEVRWRPRPWFRAVVEWDHERMIERELELDQVRLKDAFLELRPGRFRIRAGQLKSPISPIEMESRWDLPCSERGLLSDVLGFSFGISGRRPGLELRWNQRRGPLVATAALQRATSTRGERIGDESFDNVARDWGALTTTARLAWEGKRLELGGAFSLRPAEPLAGDGYERFWTAGGDLSWRAKSRTGARFWAEAYVGSSWQDANAFDGTATRFVAGRVLGAWSVYLRERDSFYLEPFLMGALLEPDTTVRDDLVWEATAGFHLGAFGHLRLVLEAQRRGVSRNLPASLGLAAAGTPPARPRTRLVAQIGAAF